ncbi:hypothetical protein HAX54_038443 [Datura stramonium]|uniref:Uncharacterized protein n=1 Tax=Datura stramonium TaxID=4076 RepID=A0ABS8VJS0_DATST|nr:hypothetical protein [Datura stramonium]
MLLKKPIHIDTDLKIEGAVTWVGRSSMEIQLEVMQSSPEASSTSESLALTANFTFRQHFNKRYMSSELFDLPATTAEKHPWSNLWRILDAGELLSWLMQATYAFAGSAPCFVEVDHVDFLKPLYGLQKYSCPLLYLLSHGCHLERRVQPLHRSVDVGDFLRLKSCVLYTELENSSKSLINVEVLAHVMRPG